MEHGRKQRANRNLFPTFQLDVRHNRVLQELQRQRCSAAFLLPLPPLLSKQPLENFLAALPALEGQIPRPFSDNYRANYTPNKKSTEYEKKWPWGLPTLFPHVSISDGKAHS